MTISHKNRTAKLKAGTTLANASFQISEGTRPSDDKSVRNPDALFERWLERNIARTRKHAAHGITITGLALAALGFTAPRTQAQAFDENQCPKIIATRTANQQKLPELKWGDSLPTAIQQSKTTGKPILVDFYTDWCGWCKELDKTYVDSRVKLLGSEFILVKLDAEGAGKALSEKYKVQAYPTLLVLDSAGKETKRIEGFRDGDAFTSDLAGVLSAQRSAQLSELTNSAPRNAEALARWATVLAGTGKFDEAQRFLQRAALEDPNRNSEAVLAAYSALANAHFEKKNWKSAIPVFEELIKRSHETRSLILGQLMLAICHLRNGDSTQALRWAQAVKANAQTNEDEKEVADQIITAARGNKTSSNDDAGSESTLPAGARSVIEA